MKVVRKGWPAATCIQENDRFGSISSITAYSALMLLSADSKECRCPDARPKKRKKSKRRKRKTDERAKPGRFSLDNDNERKREEEGEGKARYGKDAETKAE